MNTGIKIMLSWFFCFIPLLLQAQGIQIEGTVYDSKTKEPLKEADVFLNKSTVGTVTDSQGKFRLKVNQIGETDSLIISFLGYQTYRIKLSRFSDKGRIFLEPSSLEFGDEILIRAERDQILKQDIPHSVTSIDFREIERIGSSEITDILKPVPSIRVEGNDLDGRRIQIRGSNANEVNVYLDGVLLNNLRFDNSADLSIIPVEYIEDLEILKGGNSTLLGNGAFGGVINISTRQPDKTGAFIKGKTGTFNSRYLLGNIDVFIKNNLSISYFGQYHEFEPAIEYFPGERYSEKTVNSQITTRRQNHMATLNYFTGSGQFISRFITYFNDYRKPFWESDYENYLSVLSYKGDILGLKNFDVNINHFYSKNLIRRVPDGTLFYRNLFKTNRLNVNLAKKFQYRATDIQLMAEYFHDDLKNNASIEDVGFNNKLTDEFFYDNKLSGAAVFSFSDFLKGMPNLSWKTYLGIRGDAVASGHSDISPSFGAKLNYRNGPWELSPYLNYGKNVRYPTLLENAYIRNISNLSGSDTLANRLDPEYNNAAETGFNVVYYTLSPPLHNIDFSIEIFQRTSFNKLITRPVDEELIYVQIGRNITRGLETSLKFNEVLKRFYITASAVFLDVSDPLLYAYKPEKNISLGLNFLSAFGLHLNSTFFYEGKSNAWYIDTDNVLQTDEIEEYYDMDVSVGCKIPLKIVEAELLFSGYNILDNSGFKYYYLKKKYLQFSLALRY
ncbi:MAG: TonB-dependent receptor [Calditrichaeota bacterium]|nr:TonB-dependent receptor [Calditrichota bacterium]RQW02010.1 MAG: TonB-dependent receptor [Calditrichota bacterium]